MVHCVAVHIHRTNRPIWWLPILDLSLADYVCTIHEFAFLETGRPKICKFCKPIAWVWFRLVQSLFCSFFDIETRRRLLVDHAEATPMHRLVLLMPGDLTRRARRVSAQIVDAGQKQD
jgi:hypothetical protein